MRIVRPLLLLLFFLSGEVHAVGEVVHAARPKITPHEPKSPLSVVAEALSTVRDVLQQEIPQHSKHPSSSSEAGERHSDLLEAINNLVLEWRSVDDNSPTSTYYDRFTGAISAARQTTGGQAQNQNAEGENNWMPPSLTWQRSFQGSVPLNEAHSVPAAFLMWVAVFLYASARNMSGSNPSAGDMKPATSAQMRRESSLFMSSKPLTTFQDGNSSTQNSCLLGNFLMGFAVGSLFLAFWFAPPEQRGKVLLSMLMAMGATTMLPNEVPPEADEERFVKDDSTSAEQIANEQAVGDDETVATPSQEQQK